MGLLITTFAASALFHVTFLLRLPLNGYQIGGNSACVLFGILVPCAFNLAGLLLVSLLLVITTQLAKHEMNNFVPRPCVQYVVPFSAALSLGLLSTSLDRHSELPALGCELPMCFTPSPNTPSWASYRCMTTVVPQLLCFAVFIGSLFWLTAFVRTQGTRKDNPVVRYPPAARLNSAAQFVCCFRYVLLLCGVATWGILPFACLSLYSLSTQPTDWIWNWTMCFPVTMGAFNGLLHTCWKVHAGEGLWGNFRFIRFAETSLQDGDSERWREAELERVSQSRMLALSQIMPRVNAALTVMERDGKVTFTLNLDRANRTKVAITMLQKCEEADDVLDFESLMLDDVALRDQILLCINVKDSSLTPQHVDDSLDVEEDTLLAESCSWQSCSNGSSPIDILPQSKNENINDEHKTS